MTRARAKHLASLVLLAGFLLLNAATSKARRRHPELDMPRFREYCEEHRDDPCCALQPAWEAAGTPLLASDGAEEVWHSGGLILKIRDGYQASEYEPSSPARVGFLGTQAVAEAGDVDPDQLQVERWDPIVRTRGPSVALVRHDGPTMLIRAGGEGLILIGYEPSQDGIAGRLQCHELKRWRP